MSVRNKMVPIQEEFNKSEYFMLNRSYSTQQQQQNASYDMSPQRMYAESSENRN